MLEPITRIALVLSTFTVGLSAPADAAASGPMSVYLLNGGFNTPQPGIAPGDPANTPPPPGPLASGTVSASKYWTTWAIPMMQITSWLTTSPDGFYTANLVYTGGPGGLVAPLSQSPTQWVYVPENTSTNVNSVGAWVWVVEGQISIQLGNGGSAGGPWHQSQTAGTWEWVGGCGRADGLNTQIVIYGSTEPSLFYVDDAIVTYDPACDGTI